MFAGNKYPSIEPNSNVGMILKSGPQFLYHFSVDVGMAEEHVKELFLFY
jgi:hypothetical protein